MRASPSLHRPKARRVHLPAIALVALASLGVLGCADELPSPSTISKIRILGARSEVIGDAQRATPTPGEAVLVRWHVAFPDAAVPLGWLLTACLRAPALTGQPTCLGGPIAFAVQLEPILAEPTLSLLVPSEADLDTATEILVAGSICNGLVNLDDRKTQPCARRQDEGQLVILTFPIDRAGAPNYHPTVEAIELAGAPWIEDAPSDTPRTGCAMLATIPQISASSGAPSLSIRVTPTSYETYSVLEGDPPALTTHTETMTLSHLTTAGYLDSLFIQLNLGENAQPIWTLPDAADIASDGTHVRVHVVVRDGRGGIEWQRRSLCLLP